MKEGNRPKTTLVSVVGFSGFGDEDGAGDSPEVRSVVELDAGVVDCNQALLGSVWEVSEKYWAVAVRAARLHGSKLKKGSFQAGDVDPGQSIDQHRTSVVLVDRSRWVLNLLAAREVFSHE